ncbi:glycosyltransferase family 2 protein [Acetobacter sp.]|uniref:glycosyltransferase family 2 protein n=1 Tax=Acetobacter sp. TaxID=440 RepID=UPI0039ED43A6
MRFSLVIPTLNRPEDVRAFLKALADQPVRDLEVIIVDQSGLDIYDSVVDQFSSLFPIQHIRIDIKKCRYACRVGADAASGDIIAFPDDDCLYRRDTLERVLWNFEQNPKLDFVTGPILNLEGASSNMGRWLTHDAFLNERNIWIGLIEFNLFIRRSAYEQVGGLDVNMGPGCRFVAAEGQDLGLRLLHAGFKGFFDTRLRVMHPDKSDSLDNARARGYGCGMGYAMRKNHAPLSIVLRFFIRPLGGALLNALRGYGHLSLYYLSSLQGRVEGYFARQARLAAQETARS